MTTGRTDQLHQFLAHQRWFAGKGREFAIESVEPLDWLTEPGQWPAVRIELVTVRSTDPLPVNGAAESAYDVYQLPIAYRLEPGDNLAHAHIGEWKSDELAQFVFAYDACFDKEAMSVWLRGLLSEHAAARTAFHRLGQLDIEPTESALVLSAEQSNTSVVFGEAALLKVFRRIHAGRNQDIAVHEVLAKNDCANVARLFGWVDGTWTAPDGGTAHGDLAMFSEFFRTASDGWELALTSVRDLYAEGDLHADEVGGDFAGESHRLGATTAQVHHDLARLMSTATLGATELAELVAGMNERLDRAVAAVPALTEHAPALRACYAAFADWAEPIAVQHVHGDLHLGQVMRTVGGWRLIDFEGEPGRPFEERGMLDSPLRDVAGMLRSFDYAARALLIDRGDSAQLVYRAAEWADRNRAAFCEGYAEVAGPDPRSTEVVLDAYETDKAVYEVMYEARMRPNWSAIPLAAIERLAGRHARKLR